MTFCNLSLLGKRCFVSGILFDGRNGFRRFQDRDDRSQAPRRVIGCDGDLFSMLFGDLDRYGVTSKVFSGTSFVVTATCCLTADDPLDAVRGSGEGTKVLFGDLLTLRGLYLDGDFNGPTSRYF